jgi:hypothetical protein
LAELGVTPVAKPTEVLVDFDALREDVRAAWAEALAPRLTAKGLR